METITTPNYCFVVSFLATDMHFNWAIFRAEADKIESERVFGTEGNIKFDLQNKVREMNKEIGHTEQSALTITRAYFRLLDVKIFGK